MFKRIFTIIIICLGSLIGFGSSYQFISTSIDEARFTPVGTIANNSLLHYLQTGSQGPSVVLEAGLGCLSLDWTIVQGQASKFARVFSYDRHGYSWSKESSTSRTIDTIVQELHHLLYETNFQGPYILVGHSFGGSLMLYYAMQYPEEVQGIILVDATHALQTELLSEDSSVGHGSTINYRNLAILERDLSLLILSTLSIK
jgi:pimeloyl-ACP methyl ester carboxylesterase